MKEKNIEKIMELWEGDHVEFPSKSNSKDIIELYIKNLCELCEYPLKEIKWINEYEKIEVNIQLGGPISLTYFTPSPKYTK
jgi:hypothetical protein